MKEEKKTLMIIKAVLFVSMISLFASLSMNTLMILMPQSGQGWYNLGSARDLQQYLSPIAFILLLSFLILYTVSLLRPERKIRIASMAVGIVHTFASLLFSALTAILFPKEGVLVYIGTVVYSIFSTFLFQYFAGFVVSLFLTLFSLHGLRSECACHDCGCSHEENRE